MKSNWLDKNFDKMGKNGGFLCDDSMVFVGFCYTRVFRIALSQVMNTFQSFGFIVVKTWLILDIMWGMTGFRVSYG